MKPKTGPMPGPIRIFLFLIICTQSGLSQDSSTLENLRPTHPRLLWPADQTEAVRDVVKTDPLAGQLQTYLLARADRILDESPVERVLEGRRLLRQSRKAFERIVLLAMEWRLTGDRRYLDRAEQELLAAAAFKDWNPPHFLDVAEMTAALAIGYDWLFDHLSESTRSTVREAIVRKGLKPSFQYEELFTTNSTNWNQVCNGGVVLGALAVAKDEPELAAQIVDRAVRGVPTAMQVTDPDGVYPEGPGYWSYGTHFNILLIAALQSALGTDFGLADRPGFRHSMEFIRAVTGPTGDVFNFSDGSSRLDIEPASYWFAGLLEQPSIAEMTDVRMREAFSDGDGTGKFGVRFAPLILLWRGQPSQRRSGGSPSPLAGQRAKSDRRPTKRMGCRSALGRDQSRASG